MGRLEVFPAAGDVAHHRTVMGYRGKSRADHQILIRDGDDRP
jgi:hypothetical protein